MAEPHLARVQSALEVCENRGEVGSGASGKETPVRGLNVIAQCLSLLRSYRDFASLGEVSKFSQGPSEMSESVRSEFSAFLPEFLFDLQNLFERIVRYDLLHLV